MTKAVLITRVDPSYDDLPEVRYHFPRTYLRQAEAAVGDWVVYYEPRRRDASAIGGRQAYFATARIRTLVPDPARDDHFYALVEDFIPFDRPVPFREADGFYYETALRKEDGSTNKGAFGRAVRLLPDADYDLILQAGFAHVLGRRERDRSAPDVPEQAPVPLAGFAEGEQAPFEIAPRPLVRSLTERPFRDRAFAVAIKSAYHDTCAVTGLKLINGGGRSEVQAAHIMPVAANGPDSVRNGLALSGTVHWMFDRGLISVDDDYTILTAGSAVPDTIRRLMRPDGRLAMPERPEDRPHRQFLDFHRRTIFKG